MKTLFFLLVIVISKISNAQMVTCSVSAGPDLYLCCPGNSDTLFSTVSFDSCSCTNYSYSWLPTTGLSNPSSANPVASPSTTTVYTLCVTAYRYRGCITVCCTACDVVTVTVNNACCRIGNFNSESPDKNYDGVSVYPNPAKTDFTIEFKNEIKNAEAALYDVSGRKVWSKSGVQGVGKLNVDIGMLPKGIYFIKVYSGDEEMYSKKMILE